MKYGNPEIGLINIGLNPKPITFGFTFAGSPHVEAARDTYTVPKARRALILMFDFNVTSLSQPSVVNEQLIRLYHKAIGQEFIEVINSIGYVKAVGEAKNMSANLFYPLYPGDEIKVTSTDTDVGGFLGHTASCPIIEFDV